MHPSDARARAARSVERARDVADARLAGNPWAPVSRDRVDGGVRHGGGERRQAPTRSRVTAPDTVTMRLNERLREKRRTARRRIAVKALRWGAVLGVVAALVWAVLASPVFSLDPAEVELRGLSPEIDSAAVSKVIEGQAGESLALMNVPHLQDQLEDIPSVRDARVERVWPSGLRVTLVARHPVAAIPEQQGFIIVDADSVTVGRSDTAPPGLPIMTVPVGDDRVLDAVLEVIKNLPADTLARVTTITAQTEDTVSFTLADGPRVDWGGPEDSALKAQVLQAMLTSGAAAGVAVVDVSAPTLPITKAQG